MISDPAKRQMKCSACNKLVPLDASGRFATHVGESPRAWCLKSGRFPWDPLPCNPTGRTAVSPGHKTIEEVEEWP